MHSGVPQVRDHRALPMLHRARDLLHLPAAYVATGLPLPEDLPQAAEDAQALGHHGQPLAHHLQGGVLQEDLSAADSASSPASLAHPTRGAALEKARQSREDPPPERPGGAEHVAAHHGGHVLDLRGRQETDGRHEFLPQVTSFHLGSAGRLFEYSGESDPLRTSFRELPCVLYPPVVSLQEKKESLQECLFSSRYFKAYFTKYQPKPTP